MAEEGEGEGYCSLWLTWPTSFLAAVELYTRADIHGHWKAAFNLALVYETGAGVTPVGCLLLSLPPANR